MAGFPRISLTETIHRFWPLFILLFLGILYFGHVQISMSQSDLPADVRKAAQAKDIHGGCSSSSNDKAMPYALTLALVHYATSNITPQQTRDEIMVTANILSRRGPCNFLVFGLGFDSPLWHSLNHGGRTVFLEEDPSWIAQMARAHPYLTSYPVNYTTILSDADNLLAYTRSERTAACAADMDLLQSPCSLALKTLPPQVYSTRWDVIMIDAPTGYYPEAPGRMSAIFSSALMAKSGSRKQSTDILVHDVDRPVEQAFGTEFLCSKNLIEAVGKLWHFQIFGEGSTRSKDFCTTSYAKAS